MERDDSLSRSLSGARCGPCACFLAFSLIVAVLLIKPLLTYGYQLRPGVNESWSVWAIEDPLPAVIPDTSLALAVPEFLFLLLSVHILPAILALEISYPENRGPPRQALLIPSLP